MSNYMAEQINEVQELAYCYMDKHEIALITDVVVTDIADSESDVGRAFLKGRLMRKAEFNQAIIKLTSQLSSPAMAIEHKIAETTRLNDLKR